MTPSGQTGGGWGQECVCTVNPHTHTHPSSPGRSRHTQPCHLGHRDAQTRAHTHTHHLSKPSRSGRCLAHSGAATTSRARQTTLRATQPGGRGQRTAARSQQHLPMDRLGEGVSRCPGKTHTHVWLAHTHTGTLPDTWGQLWSGQSYPPHCAGTAHGGSSVKRINTQNPHRTCWLLKTHTRAHTHRAQPQTTHKHADHKPGNAHSPQQHTYFVQQISYIPFPQEIGCTARLPGPPPASHLEHTHTVE